MTKFNDLKRNVAIIVAQLKECSNSRDLTRGKLLHSEATENGLEDHIYVANTLISMYSKCGSMFEAQKSFDRIFNPDVVSWNALILGYAENGQGEIALDSFFRMRSEPNDLTFLAALKACGFMATKEIGTNQFHVESLIKLKSLEKTMIVHSRASDAGFDGEILVANTLIDTYAHCGSSVDARTVFDRMACRTVVSWTVLILGYVENGEAEIAIELFHACVKDGWEPTARAFVGGIRACTSLAAREHVQQETGLKLVKPESLKLGANVHRSAANAGYESDIFVTSSLIDMYSKCGSTGEARKIFDRRQDYKCIVTRTSMMLGYAENGEGELALEIFNAMKREGCEPDSRAYVTALKACVSLAASEQGQSFQGKVVKLRSLENGMRIHAQASETGLDTDIFVASSLVDMYSKCGSMRDASRVFYELMPHHSVVAWTSFILGYVENDDEKVAVQLFETMQALGCEPNVLTYVAALKACIGLAVKEEGTQVGGALVKTMALERGLDIQARLGQLGLVQPETFVANALMDMYGKCGSMLDARSLFDRMQFHSVLSWNALVRGYAETGDGELALALFSCMSREGCAPNAMSFVAAIKACTSRADNEDSTTEDGKQVKLKSLEMVKCLQVQASERAFDRDVFVMNSLVDAYSKCGSLLDATRSFNGMCSRTVVSWNALILGYAENGEGAGALDLFTRMQSEGYVPDGRTYFAAFKACISLATTNTKLALQRGSCIHLQASKNQCNSDVLVANTVVDMYVKCRSLSDARKVFDGMTTRTAITWTSLILGYAENGEESEALKLFERMRSEGCAPNSQTFVAVLKACTGLAEKEAGTKVHGKLVKLRTLEMVMAIHSLLEGICDSNLMVMNSLVDVYTKCGSLADARRVFDRMKTRSLVSWNTLILGYVENGEAEVALELLSCMQYVEDGLQTDARTYVAALKACSALVAAEAGRAVHADVWRSGVEGNAIVESCLLDLYGRCGNMVRARQVFDMFQSRDLVVWNALLVGYSREGNAAEVFTMFCRMLDEELCPDGISLVAVLTACSHAGLFGKGKDIFQVMSTKYGVSPCVEHYHCMIDLLGRANQLEEAVKLVKGMDCKTSAVTWGTLLAACKKWKNVEVAKMAFEELVRLDERDGAAYVAMASVYESSGMFKEQAETVEKRRK